MGKQSKNKKKNRDRYRNEYDDKSSYMPKTYNIGGADSPGRPKNEGQKSYSKERWHYNPDPVVKTIRDELIRQINSYEDAIERGVELKVAAEQLFYLPDYPCELANHPDYLLYQLDRNVRVSKKDPNLLYTPSTIIVVMNKDTKLPVFLVKVHMNPKDPSHYRGFITISEMNENGPIRGHFLQHRFGDDPPAEQD